MGSETVAQDTKIILGLTIKAQGATKHALVKRMSTSRFQLDRLLNPDVAAVQLDRVARAWRALGKRL